MLTLPSGSRLFPSISFRFMSQINIEGLHVKFLLVLYVVLVSASLVFVTVFS